MSLWNKILLGLIFVASLPYAYLAMRTLKTHQYWRQSAQQHEKRLDAVTQENRELIRGTGEGEDYQSGIQQLRLDLHKTLIDRGRVWRGCQPTVNADSGQAAVTTDLPDPHGITNKMIFYVFEQSDEEDENDAQRRQYIGEFKVTDVAEKLVQLEPSMKLKPDSAEFQRLTSSRGPWVLYEIMPIDNHEVFADFEEDELKSIMPESTVMEYLKDGQPATVDDLATWNVRGKVVDEKGQEVQGAAQGTYVRQLRDYEILFKDYHLQETILFDEFESTTRDKQYVDVTLAATQTQEQFRQQVKAQLNTKLAERQRELGAVGAHRKALESKLSAVTSAITGLIARNMATATQIAKIQLEAARRIDQRTRNVARNGADGS